MDNVLNERHHVDLVLRVHTDDGLYIPLENPLTEDEKKKVLALLEAATKKAAELQ